MDPFSVALGTLSIAEAALQSINTLIYAINAIKDAPSVIVELKNELAAVNAILIALNDAQRDKKLEALTLEAKTALQLAITNCARACDNFSTKLKQWTKHSNEKIHWWDRVRIGLFAEATIEALSKQLSCCKSTMSTAVSTAVLLTTATSTSINDTMQSGLREKEITISQRMIEIDEQNTETEKALQQANTAQYTDDSDPSGLIEQLQDQRIALDLSRKFLENLLSEAHHIRTGQKITKVDMSDGGKLLVGLINYESSREEVRQEIRDVKATSHGKGVVGMVKGFDVNSFFKD
ncbi:hypothetical protein AAWM_11165 [Aspergillus awamori]|uniref:Azaphilone pigments biosynthesis cluster protein L N-terminal domain-containing protein n=1 Tax=Aspergillus awamori TaxID=105351 RepID=A0A401L9W6_ASPAW|nr:hypothetical protein AAWM_11165 [Aspergillus awamori]GKZ63424.1 hypothetical protein AnigIFM49718_011832 [Aspergillus niger]